MSTVMVSSGRRPVRSRFARLGAIVAAASAIVGLAVSGLVAAPAHAANAADFDPGFIISDELMYTDSAMSEEQIQEFLTQKANSVGCTSSKCLHKFTMTTSAKSSDINTCSPYAAGAGESAARIIYKVQKACKVSAKVLLVTLQKEQGLILSKGPGDTALKIATGYACPDTAACDTKYYGFDNQVYWAALAFVYYRNHAGDSHEVRTQSVRYHPNASCGSKTVSIKNEATAALYNYTPYTPNAAALANLYTTGDSCSSYGNRNFWAFYTDWFGSPVGKVAGGVAKSRVAGDDRYETSAAISRSVYSDQAIAQKPVTTVYVASGENYPDGLSAAPAAAAAGGPLLLTKKSSLPSVIKQEINRLKPDLIVIVGGTPTISSDVEKELKKLANVKRIAGADRYETSRLIAKYAFPNGSPEVFIAIGSNFPDALAASGAAGSRGIPVVLVPKGAKSADSATKSLIKSLGATKVVAAGDSKAIKASYLDSTKSGTSVTKTVRLGGSNRYQTAALINEWAYASTEQAYLVSGEKYPDALSAAAVAGSQGAALHLSPGSCIPAPSVSHMTWAGVRAIVFVGSEATLSKKAWNYTSC